MLFHCPLFSSVARTVMVESPPLLIWKAVVGIVWRKVVSLSKNGIFSFKIWDIILPCPLPFAQNGLRIGAQSEI